ncbi:MAG: hypothetical protein ACR2ML_07390, partial [Solirubrobacteraceae bacterium]
MAIGFVALFFLLSTVCSAINEGIANVLGWRAKTLEDAIHSLLVGEPPRKKGRLERVMGGLGRIGRPTEPRTDTVGRLFSHWRIKGLVRNPES